MALDFNEIILDTMDEIIVKDITTGQVRAILDELTDGTFDNTVDKTYLSGAGGVQLATLYRNKKATFSCSNAFLSYNALRLQTGSEAEFGSATNKIIVPKIDYITITTADEATLEFEPVGVPGAEVSYVYLSKKDNSANLQEPLEVDSTVSTGKFTVDAANKKLEFAPGEVNVGDLITVVYEYEEENAVKISNEARTFPGSGDIIINCTGRDKCDQDKIYHVVIRFPNASIDGAFSLSFGNDAVPHPFACEANATKCNNVQTLWEWYVVK